MIPTDILNYRVLRLIGSGGMGSVYLAANTNIDQQVAIKALRPEVARNAVLRAKFKQEAELLCSLDHPGIVKFLNYVETSDGVFLIMEYVKGVTLEDFIKKKNGLIVEKKAYPLICEILDAFSYAHSKGIVHRDIKPSNIIIQDDGHIKVMDFGIAQIVSEANVTESQYVMGTPTYMSPEQIYGKNVDVRSDIYSLGVLIHNMLTGRAPYDSTMMTAQEIKSHIVKDNMPRMSEYYPYISDKIQFVVDKATQKVPEARYQSCKEMKAAVKKAIAPDPIPRPLLYTGIAAVILLLGAGLFTWDYYRTKVDYYKDYVEIFGIPQGIGSLSKREMSHREASYRFEYCQHKLRRVSYVNSKGKLVNHHDSEDKDKIVDMTLTYTEGSEKIDAAKYMNCSGKVLYVKDYDTNFKTCTFKLDDELGTEMTLNSQVSLFQSAFDSQLEGKSKISKYILSYDEKGRLEKVEYAGFGNVRVPDGQGIFGRSYVYDKEGRVIEEHYLGKDGKAKATQFGLGIKLFEYDKDDNLSKIEYQTTDGKPSSDGNNCPIVLLEYDKWGNRQFEKYTDISGQMMIRKDDPFAGVMYQYDDEGFLVKQLYIGLDGNLTYIKGVSGYVNEYDENGYLSKRTMIDANGNVAFFNDAEDGTLYAKVALTNDEHGNPTDIKFLNAVDELMEGATWKHKTCSYDSIGNLLTEFYHDADGKLYAPPSLGYAGFKVSYNSQGRVETITYLDKDKERVNLANQHFCYIKREYDARGNYTRVSYLDNKDQLVMTNEGIAAACYEYDDNGNEVARYFIDKNEKPCVLNYYYSRCEYGYDDQGNIVSERYKNADGKLMTVGGCAGIDRTFDLRGNVVKKRPIGVNGSLAAGMQETRYIYDERDNVIEESYYGNNGNAVNCEGGYHKINKKYNSRNLCIQEEYFGINGQLSNVKGQNFAVVKKEYDERGNNTSITYFTQSGTRGNDNSKVHKYFNQFDKVVNKVNHQISFGLEGDPIITNGVAKEGRVEYDKKGNRTKLICYDGYGKKCDGERGWCEMRFTYDDSGLQTSEAYYSLDEKPYTDKELKYHKIVYTYNSMRLTESATYYGANDKPINGSSGYSTTKYKYNDQNQRTQISYYGANGKAVDNKNGWHREVYYFKAGAEYKCELYSQSGKKVATALRTNNGWNVQGVGQSNAGNNWRSSLAEFTKACPIDTGNGVIIESVQVSNEMVKFSLRYENLSSDEITSEMLSNLTTVKAGLRKLLSVPSHIEIIIVLYDKYGNIVNENSSIIN